MALLEVKDLEVNYGVIRALKGINFHVNKGEIVTLIGANGAGKTTTMQSVIGLIPIKSGHVVYNDQDITKTPCHKLVNLGMSQVPEGRRIFQELTVYENLMMGAYSIKKNDTFKDDIEMVYKRFPRLEERKSQIASTLSGGEQQMLAMGRALMSHPDILLLDEPSMGLSPLLVTEIFDIIQEINKEGTTILLVEQNAKKALSIADRAYVLETGSIVLEGDAKEMMNNDDIKKAYLGE
ncbi:MAG: ABC transporter ATP-binding protein [Clostridia bacterium]|nr:ABC transporter ATP-binding protein [Clostridia bacterium]